MEAKKGPEEREEHKLGAEWERPSVKELDINAITLSGTGALVFDGAVYS